MVIAWLSLPPEELMATRDPRRIMARHSGGMAMPGRRCGVRPVMPPAVVVSQDHGLGDRNEQRLNCIFRLSAVFGRRAPVDGDDGGRRLAVHLATEESEVVVVAAGERLEGAAVFLGDVGRHDVDPRLDDAASPGTRRSARSDSHASTGHCGARPPGGIGGLGGWEQCGVAQAKTLAEAATESQARAILGSVGETNGGRLDV